MESPPIAALIVPESSVLANGITIDAAIASYHRHLRAANRSPAIIRTYLAAALQGAWRLPA